MKIELLLGDSFHRMSLLGEQSIKAVICDPPYGLEFMGKEWDAPWKYGFSAPGLKGKNFPDMPSFQSSRNPVCKKCHRMKRGSVRHESCECDDPMFDDVSHRISDRHRFQVWSEGWLRLAFQALGPVGTIKVFCGTRMFHRIAAGMENAGFVDIGIEAWIYGSGFPKSLNVPRAIDKLKGAVRKTKRMGFSGNALMRHGGDNTRPWMEEALEKGYHEMPGDDPVTDDAKIWEGWGTALKPAWEPVLVGHKVIATPDP